MERQWHEVLIENDEGDAPFSAAAPALIEALRLIAATRALPFTLGVACRELETLNIDLPRYAYALDREDIERTHDLVFAQFSAVITSFLPVTACKAREKSSFSENNASSPQESLLHSRDGLVAPREVQFDAFLELFPSMDYDTFRAQFERLSQIMSNAQLFSACEPRMKILQSRYRLYRAFNGLREDQFHPTLGGGDIKKAPKVDVRRIHTCVTAGTLTDFMQETLAKSPNLVLRYSRGERHRAEKESVGEGEKKEKQKDHLESGEEDVTLESLANAFFGPYSTPEERYFTPEGLGLLSNYSAASERFSDLFDSRETSRPHLVNAVPLLRHFLNLYGGNEGELLARLVMPALSRVTSNPNEMLELEFTVSGRVSGELLYIASWCARNGIFDSGANMQLSLRIAQQSFDNADGLCTAQTLDDVIQNIFSPIWLALLGDETHRDVAGFLKCLASVAVAIDSSADLQELPSLNNPSSFVVGNGVTVPDAYFVFHVWRNVQMINSMVTAHLHFTAEPHNMEKKDAAKKQYVDGEEKREDAFSAFVEKSFLPPSNSFFRACKPVMMRPMHFRLHTSEASRNAFMESVLGLLLADDVVNPAEVFAWSPLAYLYYLTQRKVVVTPSRNSNHSLQGAVPYIVETGLNGTVISLDPLHYHTHDDALFEELNGLLKVYHLATADVTELCFRSADGANWSAQRRRKVLGGHSSRVRAAHNTFTKTQINSLRLHFRESCLAHEVDLLCRKGLKAEGGMSFSPFVNQQEREALPCKTIEAQRAVLWIIFDVPQTRAIRREAEAAAGRSRFVEEQIKYPRIVIAGPKIDEKNEDAHHVARMLQRQQYYADFNIHYEPPPPQLQSVQGTDNLERVNEIFFPLPKPTALSLGSGEDAQSLNQCTESTRHSSVCTPVLSQMSMIEVPERFLFLGGVCDVALPPHSTEVTRKHFRPLPSWTEFQKDVRWLRKLSSKRSVQVYAQKRLGMLECKFNLHAALTNDDQEVPKGTKGDAQFFNKGDVDNCVKVDVHCHMAGGITAKELLRFIKNKAHHHSGDFVNMDKETGKPITLAEFLGGLRTQQNGLADVEKLTVAALQVKAGNSTFNRFDRFNERYTPLGISPLRRIFLKTDNFMEGRYFAELVSETFRRQERENTTFSEFRLSIYGQKRSEWDSLSRWFVIHGMSNSTNRWMIQVPRIYSVHRRSGFVNSFGEMLRNIFVPMWEASQNPERYPFVNYFLANVSGFDSVDNESLRESDGLITITPDEWTSMENPPFSYWAYYMWVNIVALNRYRSAKGMSTFTYRPHAGESGDPDHVADTFLLADGVNHGINLKERPVLQYLYYLAQIPLGITPLSNNALFCKYHDNPFPVFFRRGLNVTLSTDNPLAFHHTEQPLIEEYSTAANFWNLSPTDISEIARNSVLMSGFPSHQKKLWLGDLYMLRSSVGNDVRLSKVPQSRCTFRYELYLEEFNHLTGRASLDVPMRPVMEPRLEGLYVMDAMGLTREQLLERRLRGSSSNVSSSLSYSSRKKAKDKRRPLSNEAFITSLSQL